MALQTTIDQPVITQSDDTQAVSSLLQHAAALAFGAAILIAVGFLPMAQAHNAAHDTRHSLAFPCH